MTVPIKTACDVPSPCIEADSEIHYAFFDIGPFAKGVENPQPPQRWRDVLRSLSDSSPPRSRARVGRFAKRPATALLEGARRLPEWQVYLDFARFPLETVYGEPDGGATVILQDLRFLPFFTGPWEPDHVKGIRRQPFVFRVRLDRTLRPVDLGFVRGGR